MGREGKGGEGWREVEGEREYKQIGGGNRWVEEGRQN